MGPLSGCPESRVLSQDPMWRRTMNLQNKVVVITGGASGLGQATARFLVQEKGARVALLDMNEAAGKETVDELGAVRSEAHTSELQSLMRNSYAVFCLTK